MGWWEDTFEPVQSVIADIGHSAENAWQDAGRGEIGRLVGGFGQSLYNIPVGLYQAVSTGRYDTGLQKTFGSALNVATGGLASYAGQSSGVQDFLRNKDLNAWTGGIFEDVGGITHGINTTANEGVLSNSDRNLAIQGLVKGGVAYGAFAGYNALTAPAAGNPATGAVLIDDAYAPNVLNGGAVTSQELASPAISAFDAADGVGVALGPPDTIGAAVEAANAGGFWSSVGSGALSTVKIGAEIGIAKQILGPSGGGYFGGGDNSNPYPLIPSLSNFFPGAGGSAPTTTVTQPQSAVGSKPSAAGGAGTAVLLAVGAFFLVRRLAK